MKKNIDGIEYDLTPEEEAEQLAKWAEEDAKLLALLKSNTWSAYKASAQNALDKSDVTVTRLLERGLPVLQDIQQYRNDLRTIIRATDGDPSQPLPARPGQPYGI